jgi:hypothetical protein
MCAAPAFLFDDLRGECGNVYLRTLAVDFGLVQLDPRTFSLAETAKKLGALITDAGQSIEREREFLKRENAGAVWCDVPFLPFEAAAREGLPALGMGNFSWDWIYSYYRAADPVFSQAAEFAHACYQECSLFFALPKCAPVYAFSNREDIPLVTRLPRFSREEARAFLGIAEEECAILLGLSELSLDATACARLETLATAPRGAGRRIRFIVPAPIRLELACGIFPRPPEGSEKRALPGQLPHWDFASLVAASDLVITKLGYGIVSDAVVNRVPLVYTERGDFPELPYLEALVKETVGGVPLSREDFEAGRWEESIETACARHTRGTLGDAQFSIPLDGAAHAAERFLAFTGL